MVARRRPRASAVRPVGRVHRHEARVPAAEVSAGIQEGLAGDLAEAEAEAAVVDEEAEGVVAADDAN